MQRKLIYLFFFIIFFLFKPSNAEETSYLETLVENIPAPSSLAVLPDEDLIFVLLHKEGMVKVIQNNKIIDNSFLDLSDKMDDIGVENGLLSLVFHPDFPEKNYIFVSYTSFNYSLFLSRYEIDIEKFTVIEKSEKTILELINKGEPGHHCGYLAIHPITKDLYFCIGDNDLSGNPSKNSQDSKNIESKILRFSYEDLHKNTDINYEFVAMGLRNSWKFSFDESNGDVFVPDIGQTTWEELNFVSNDRFLEANSENLLNFGWYHFEGFDCNYPGKIHLNETDKCENSNFIFPVYAYPHGDLGYSITGGVVYRGDKYLDWQGVYFFSDWVSGRIMALKKDQNANWLLSELYTTGINFSFIDQGLDGEILMLDYTNGRILNFIPPTYNSAAFYPIEFFLKKENTIN